MVKNIPFLLILILTELTAQDSYSQNYRFGFRAGVNYSNMNFNGGYQQSATPQTNWRTGFTLGFLLQVRLTENLSIQPEYLYTNIGCEIKSLKTVYRLNYLIMPVLLRYKFLPKLAFLAGPEVGLLINAKENSTGSFLSITHDMEERNLAARAGVEFQLRKSLFIEARYIQGLDHVALRQPTNVKEFTTQILQLSACVKF